MSAQVPVGPRPSPAGVSLSHEERARRRSAALQAARDALAAAPPMRAATRHAYGPHDPSTAPMTQMVYPTGVKWPTKFEDAIPDAVRRQRRDLNNLAHRLGCTTTTDTVELSS